MQNEPENTIYEYNLNLLISRCRQNDPTLTKLDISINLQMIPEKHRNKVFSTLLDVISHNTVITELALVVHGDEVKQLCAVLQSNTSIHSLSLANSILGSYEMGFLYELLEKNSTLVDLNLIGSLLAMEDNLILFSNTLGSESCHLKSLTIGNNNISPIAVNLLCENLKKNTALTYLNLIGNPIYDRGIQLICDMLRENTTLSSLNLMTHSLTIKSIEHLCDALKYNTTVTELYINVPKFAPDPNKNEEEVKKSESHYLLQKKKFELLLERNRLLHKYRVDTRFILSLCSQEFFPLNVNSNSAAMLLTFLRAREMGIHPFNISYVIDKKYTFYPVDNFEFLHTQSSHTIYYYVKDNSDDTLSLFYQVNYLGRISQGEIKQQDIEALDPEFISNLDKKYFTRLPREEVALGFEESKIFLDIIMKRHQASPKKLSQKEIDFQDFRERVMNYNELKHQFENNELFQPDHMDEFTKNTLKVMQM